MKKLLLLSLLVVGAKSFSAISVPGTQAEAQLPVKVTGTVIENNTQNILIESNTAGMNGNVMTFTFNNVKKGGTASQSGDFTVKRVDESVLASSGMGSSENQLRVGLGDTYLAKDKTADAGSGVAVDYIIAGNLDSAKKVYSGTLQVNIDASGATAGDFSDMTKAIYVKVGA